MHQIVQNLIKIKNEINSNLSDIKSDKIPKIIAVSKTFGMEKILPLVEYGHIDFGENKVQEAIEKWTDIKSNNNNIKLHLIGGLQTNKVKLAVKFDFLNFDILLWMSKNVNKNEFWVFQRTFDEIVYC